MPWIALGDGGALAQRQFGDSDREARPIRPSLGMAPEQVDNFMTASDDLPRNAIA